MQRTTIILKYNPNRYRNFGTFCTTLRRNTWKNRHGCREHQQGRKGIDFLFHYGGSEAVVGVVTNDIGLGGLTFNFISNRPTLQLQVTTCPVYVKTMHRQGYREHTCKSEKSNMMTGLRPALKICFVQMLVLCGEAVVGVVAYAMCFGLCSMFNNAHAKVAGANPARGLSCGHIFFSFDFCSVRAPCL